MSQHTQQPPPPVKTLETTNGVTIHVHPPRETDRLWSERYDEPEDESDLAPRPLPEPEPFPRAIILPANQSAEERAAFIRGLYEQHGAFILDTLEHRYGVKPESAKDLRQSVILILLDHYDRGEVPQNMRGYLQGVMRNEARNHGKVKRPAYLPEGDADTEISPATNPESAVARAERRAKIERYIGHLPPEEAEVIRLVDLTEMTIDAAAKMLDRPRGGVVTQLFRARKTLRDLALASERATTLGAYRR